VIVPLRKEHAEQVARLHISGIPTGFISSLGERFVTALYEAIVESPFGFGFVEEKNGTVLGFVAFTTSLKGLYKTIFLKRGFYFLFILFRKLISRNTIRKMFETLFYPTRSETKELPQAELLSIAVKQSERGKSIARNLIQHGLRKCNDTGIKKVKALVADFNKPANQLYRTVRFELAGQIESHGIISNIYVIDTDLLKNNPT
jgi:ribosomal protein S18 acetylase RimI-like enzyme